MVKLHKNKEFYKSMHKIGVATAFNMGGLYIYLIAEICKNMAKNENFDFIRFNIAQQIQKENALKRYVLEQITLKNGTKSLWQKMTAFDFSNRR